MQIGVDGVPPLTLDDVPGWFFPKDQAALTWLLNRQDLLDEPGDLVELGSYLGKSAILIGGHVRPGERFTVCDLFGSEPADEANRREHNWSYATLTRSAFERNYLAFHDELPTIVQASTDVITEHVAAGSCRMVHIDASHLWLHVSRDIDSARTLLRPDGIVVIDDYRAEHTPGVAAAVWAAVAVGGLRPICLTGHKFYGTWGDPGPVQQDLLEWLRAHTKRFETQEIMGHRVVRIGKWADPPVPQLRSDVPAAERQAAAAASAAAAAAARAAARPAAPPRSMRTIARDLLPPLLARAIKRGLKRRRDRVAGGRSSG